jgi:hypothetical protein
MEKTLLQELYRLAILRQSDGGIRGDRCLALNAGEQRWEMRYSTDRGQGDDAEFIYFPPGRTHSRRCLRVYEDGRLEVDDRGTVPRSDRLQIEPRLPTDSVLLQLSLVALKTLTATL